MIPARVEERLRAHVAAILAAAHVPRGDREDLAEELYGHLADRWRSLVEAGAEDMAATAEAIRDFGTARRIGSALTRTYHGTFWASTIGVLLPAGRTRAPQPPVAWWLGASLRAYGVLYVLAGAWAVANASPVRALILLFFGVAATAIIFVAAAALRRRQRWALDLAIVVNVVGLLYGLNEMLGTPGLISLNVIGSAVLLAFAAAERKRLGLWVRRSRPVRNAVAVSILGIVAGGSLLPAAARELPDPTQASDHDLHVALAIDCARDEVKLTADLRWDNVSLLPGGISNIEHYGDLLLLENSPSDDWEIEEWPTLIDVGTGATVAEPDEGYAPNQDRLAELGGGLHAIQIAWNALEPDRDYRVTWLLRRWDTGLPPTTFATSVEYIHADRFRWEALADCDRGVHDPFVSSWP